MQGSYNIFSNFWNQPPYLLGSFLKDVIIPCLCDGWLFVRDKREYTIKKFVKFCKTDYIVQCYISQRIHKSQESLDIT